MNYKLLLVATFCILFAKNSPSQKKVETFFTIKNETTSNLHLYILDQVLYGHPIYMRSKRMTKIIISSPCYLILADQKQYFTYVNYFDTIHIFLDPITKNILLNSSMDPQKSKIYNEIFQSFGSLKPGYSIMNRKFISDDERINYIKRLNSRRVVFLKNKFRHLPTFQQMYFDNSLFYTSINELIQTSSINYKSKNEKEKTISFYKDTCKHLLKYFNSKDSIFSLEYMFAAWNVLKHIIDINNIEEAKEFIQNNILGKTKQFLLTKVLLCNIDFNFNNAKSKIYYEIANLITDSF